jgi:hypothetical protein
MVDVLLVAVHTSKTFYPFRFTVKFINIKGALKKAHLHNLGKNFNFSFLPKRKLMWPSLVLLRQHVTGIHSICRVIRHGVHILCATIIHDHMVIIITPCIMIKIMIPKIIILTFDSRRKAKEKREKKKRKKSPEPPL